VGKTNSAADFISLLTDVTERLFGPLPDPTWVYPGHGDDTTLGAERPHLEEWRARGW
jgi:glyoxylase-like metal-dependent hydrolase (beta-lactamase superfamily II)